jgi:hypothetical protein
MRDAENDPHEGKRKTENVWCVFCCCTDVQTLYLPTELFLTAAGR